MSTLSDLATDLGVSPDSLRESLISEIGEALQPSYLSVNPDGSLGALSFSGRTAQGGRNTVHWSGGQLSDQLVVPHTLGVVPTAVVCTTVDPSGSGITVQTQVDFEVQNLTDTTFSVRATQPSSGILVNLDFYWIAITGDRGLTVNFATGDVSPGGAFHQIGAAGEIPFLNGWAVQSPGSGYTLPGFWLASGVVHLQGQLSGAGANNAIAFQLPIGYRPTRKVLLLAHYEISGGLPVVIGEVQIDPLGNASLWTSSETFNPNETFYSLDGLSFRAEQ